jgi:hypothetical protein
MSSGILGPICPAEKSILATGGIAGLGNEIGSVWVAL